MTLYTTLLCWKLNFKRRRKQSLSTSGTYYCPKCQKHPEPIEVEQKKTMWQDTTTGNEPIDQKELEEEAENE